MVTPMSTRRLLQKAAVREAVGDLTLRRGEEGMLRTFIGAADVEDHRWWTRTGTQSAKPFTGASEWEKLNKEANVER